MSSVLHTQRHFSARSTVKNFIAEFAERYYRIPVKNCSTLHLRSRRGAGNIINVPCGHAPVLALRVSQFQAPKRTKIIHERISSRTGFSAHLLCSDAANRKRDATGQHGTVTLRM